MIPEKSSRSISRVLYPGEPGVCHLSAGRCRHPPVAAYPSASGEQPYLSDIHGLATHSAYGVPRHRGTRWALTSPFHPYPG